MELCFRQEEDTVTAAVPFWCLRLQLAIVSTLGSSPCCSANQIPDTVEPHKP